MYYDPSRKKVQPIQRRSRRKPLSEEIKTATRLLSFALLFLGLSSTLGFLYLSSLKPAKGYQLKQLQLDYEELQSEARSLEHQIIEAQSISNLETEDSVTEMQSAQNDEYSYIDDSPYAQAN